mmetsp:Transcript_31772/g.69993  ORF Transcript_31772/g.69993 Transcript_31772/m.69993 type:complete len:259 (-) Transcript_31772:722-1498(-)
MGLAAASTELRALRDAWMPALAMVTVCCSITSWIATRSFSDILSNSSMHTTPLSASTIAPASSRLSPVSGSTVTAAVRPTPVEPRPVVEMARGAMSSTARSSCDLAVDGSPTNMTLMSPRRCVPFSRLRSQPPSSCRMSAFLMNSWPKMEGHRARDIMSSTSGRWDRSRMFFTSAPVSRTAPTSFPIMDTLLHSSTVLNAPVVTLPICEGRERYTPTQRMRSPGLALSTRSCSRITSTDLGSCPTLAFSGISCSTKDW